MDDLGAPSFEETPIYTSHVKASEVLPGVGTWTFSHRTLLTGELRVPSTENILRMDAVQSKRSLMNLRLQSYFESDLRMENHIPQHMTVPPP